MLSRNSLIHGLRRDQLIEVLSISEFPVVPVENPFIQPKSTGKKTSHFFNIDEFHVSIAPISSLKYDWEWAPIDTILIEVVIPPAEADPVSAENDFLRDAGIGHIQCELEAFRYAVQ
uniref:transfer repressor n=1 Tax=Escherichia coli TaxID=562 RepID=UPI001F1EBF5F|nr:transfer repressor [Escherichia coli]UGK56158.1 hypothetical protein [Escherichia coli]